jgi:hypothetical protein
MNIHDITDVPDDEHLTITRPILAIDIDLARAALAEGETEDLIDTGIRILELSGREIAYMHTGDDDETTP